MGFVMYDHDNNCCGTTLIEYTIIASLIALVAVSGIRALANAAWGSWNSTASIVVNSIGN